MRLFWIVAGLHLLFLLIIGIQKKEVFSAPAQIEVHTVQLQKPKPVVVMPQQKPAPKPMPPEPKPKPKATPHGKLKQLLEESLATLEESKPIQLAKPEKVGSLKSEALTFISYETLLVEYLKELLELPEQGEVKLRLTLTRAGKVTSFEILTASSANRSYMEREVASLRLPPFESRFKGEKSHTFPIILKTY